MTTYDWREKVEAHPLNLLKVNVFFIHNTQYYASIFGLEKKYLLQLFMRVTFVSRNNEVKDKNILKFHVYFEIVNRTFLTEEI